MQWHPSVNNLYSNTLAPVRANFSFHNLFIPKFWMSCSKFSAYTCTTSELHPYWILHIWSVKVWCQLSCSLICMPHLINTLHHTVYKQNEQKSYHKMVCKVMITCQRYLAWPYTYKTFQYGIPLQLRLILTFTCLSQRMVAMENLIKHRVTDLSLQAMRCKHFLGIT